MHEPRGSCNLTGMLRRMLLVLGGVLSACILSWVFREELVRFLTHASFYSFHLGWSFWKALLVGGLVLSSPWTAYQAWSYAASRVKRDVRIGPFVTASTAVVWASAWLVPRLLMPPLLAPLRMLPRSSPLARFVSTDLWGSLGLICDGLLTVCVAANVPIVVAFVVSATDASWPRLVRFGGRRVLFVCAGLALVQSPGDSLFPGLVLRMSLMFCVVGPVYYTSLAVAYLLARGRARGRAK